MLAPNERVWSHSKAFRSTRKDGSPQILQLCILRCERQALVSIDCCRLKTPARKERRREQAVGSRSVTRIKPRDYIFIFWKTVTRNSRLRVCTGLQSPAQARSEDLSPSLELLTSDCSSQTCHRLFMILVGVFSHGIGKQQRLVRGTRGQVWVPQQQAYLCSHVVERQSIRMFFDKFKAPVKGCQDLA